MLISEEEELISRWYDIIPPSVSMHVEKLVVEEQLTLALKVFVDTALGGSGGKLHL